VGDGRQCQIHAALSHDAEMDENLRLFAAFTCAVQESTCLKAIQALETRLGIELHLGCSFMIITAHAYERECFAPCFIGSMIDVLRAIAAVEVAYGTAGCDVAWLAAAHPATTGYHDCPISALTALLISNDCLCLLTNVWSLRTWTTLN